MPILPRVTGEGAEGAAAIRKDERPAGILPSAARQRPACVEMVSRLGEAHGGARARGEDECGGRAECRER